MAKKAKVTVNPEYRIGEVGRRMYGSFLEPIGNWVYGGIWNPDHPMADEMGFRKDLIALIKELDLPAVRLPGGNFMSGWEWEDSIGPKEQRKAHLDLAWRQIEPNLVGHDEYLEWARRAGVEAMYTLNLGIADIKSALHCVEYTSQPGGTYWSDLRRKHGYEQPYEVDLWYLGNEMDGPWQIGSWEKAADDYGTKAHEIAKIVKWINPKAETAVCGASTPLLRTTPMWERSVLEKCYETVDYLSIHYYHTVPQGDIAALMSTSNVIEDFLRTEIAICDYVQAKLSDPRKMMISFDEYGSAFGRQKPLEVGRKGRFAHDMVMEFSPEHLEKPFTQMDPNNFQGRRGRRQEMYHALSMSSIIMALVRHADRVKVGCMTSGLGGAVAYDSDNAWRAATFYPYAQLIKYGVGTSILPAVNGPTFNANAYDLNGFSAAPEYEDLQSIEVAAVHNEEKEEVAIFLVNRDANDDIEIDLDVRGFEGYRLVEHSEMFATDIEQANAYGQELLKPAPNGNTRLDGGKVNGLLKKLSWNMIRLAK